MFADFQSHRTKHIARLALTQFLQIQKANSTCKHTSVECHCAASSIHNINVNPAAQSTKSTTIN